MGCCSASQAKPNAYIEETSPAYQRRTALCPTSPAAYVGVSDSSLWDKYEHVRDLGSGGFGEVKLVRHRVLGVERAVKTIRLTPEAAADSIMSEIETMKALDHPNIVRILEVFRDPSHIHIVMELCTGGEFFDAIIERERFSEAEAAKYMLDLLSALAYIHRQGLVHRDIKPENLLLEDKSPDAQLKLADFGGAAWRTSQEKLQLAIGTIYYVAPEVLDKSYDEKCDVWSAGVLLHILLSGLMPFDGTDDEAIKKSIRKEKVKFKDPRWKSVSPQAKALISKMLTKNPALRPSVNELVHDPWIRQHTIAAPLSSENLRNLSTFSSLSKLQQATLSFIASQMLAQEDAKQLSKTFREMDLNKDGTLSLNEIEAAIKTLGFDRDIDLDQLLREIDADGNGVVEYTEFLVATVNWNAKLSKDKLRLAFQKYDVDGNGVISLDEFRDMFADSCETFLTGLIAEADVNGDGEIDFDEFAALMLQKFQVTN